MKTNSSRKGSKFERKVSRELSTWITDGERTDIFWRTHSSGALGTISKKKAEYGDIMHIDELGIPLTGRFNIECRHGKCIKIRDLVYLPAKSSMVQFIGEGITNADVSGRRPMWIFREQGAPIMVMMKYGDWMVGSRCHAPNISIFKFGLAVIDFEVWKKKFDLKQFTSE